MLLRMTSASATVDTEVARLTNQEIGRLTDKVIAKARQETSWGVPKILNALQSLAGASPSAEASIVAFFSEVPSSQVKPSIVPRLSQVEWGKRVLAEFFTRPDLPTPAKNAIGKVGKSK